MLLASRALWFYACKLAWPTDLAVIYPRWDIGLGDAWAWLYLAGATALAATLWFMRHRVGRGPLAGALFFAVTLSPVLSFVNFSYMDLLLCGRPLSIPGRRRGDSRPHRRCHARGQPAAGRD